MIAKGLNVVFVSRQLGHANPIVTLVTFAYRFGQADHAGRPRDPIESSCETTTNGRHEPNVRSW